MLTNNGQATFITRKSVRKLNKPLSNNQILNENSNSLALNLQKSNANFKTKTHLSRQPLINLKSNTFADSSALFDSEQNRTKNKDLCLNSFVKVICESSKVILEAVNKSGIPRERMERIQFLLSNKYDYLVNKSIDIEKIILEEISKEQKKIKLEQACQSRQKYISKLIEDRIGRLSSLIMP